MVKAEHSGDHAHDRLEPPCGTPRRGMDGNGRNRENEDHRAVRGCSILMSSSGGLLDKTRFGCGLGILPVRLQVAVARHRSMASKSTASSTMGLVR